MFAPTRRDPEVVRNTIPEERMAWLGKAGDFEYATHKGTEYAVDLHPSELSDHASVDGQILVRRISHEVIDGSRFENHRTHRAVPVPSGSFAAAEARKQARLEAQERRANPPYRGVDALAPIQALAAKLPQFLAGPDPTQITGYTSEYTGDGRAMRVHMSGLLRKQDALATPGRPAIRGLRAVLDVLEAKGIHLEPTQDGASVFVRSRGGRLDPQLREAIRATARLLAGELTGSPVRCELCPDKSRAAAVTILEVDVAACEPCAAEERSE